MNTQLVLMRAAVCLFFGTALLLWVAVGISEFIAAGNDMTDDEDFTALCARSEKS